MTIELTDELTVAIAEAHAEHLKTAHNLDLFRLNDVDRHRIIREYVMPMMTAYDDYLVALCKGDQDMINIFEEMSGLVYNSLEADYMANTIRAMRG